MITKADYDAMDEFFNGEGEAEQEAPARVFRTTCQRKVVVGRKTKLCNDTTSNSECERCSNHCQDAYCAAHGHYKRR